MICRECELRVASEDVGPETQAHLDSCRECRELAAEMAANRSALAELRDEVLPVPIPVVRMAGRPWRFAGAMAAAFLLGVALFHWRGAFVPSQHGTAAQAAVVRQAALKIKMLTSDPNVVIYWLVDSNQRDSHINTPQGE
jgi:hypothetical protein